MSGILFFIFASCEPLIVQINIQRGQKTIMYKTKRDRRFERLKLSLRVRAFFHKTVRVCHVYCNFKIDFTCLITVMFGTLKDGSLLINTLASNICFSYRNMFQNGVDALSKIVDAFFVKKFKISSSSDYPIMFKFC